MTEKVKALELTGYWAAKNDQGEYLYSSLRFREETAAELRRLHESHIKAWDVIHSQGVELIALKKQKAELLEALKLVLPTLERLKYQYADCAYESNFVQNSADTARRNYNVASAAIAKAEKENQS